RLLVSGLLDEVWTPDERTRSLRRLTNRRERLVRARTRAKNEAHGVLARNLCERPPVTDAFGKAGRRWLARLDLPVDERLTLDGCLRSCPLRSALDPLATQRSRGLFACGGGARMTPGPPVYTHRAPPSGSPPDTSPPLPCPLTLSSSSGRVPCVPRRGAAPAGMVS